MNWDVVLTAVLPPMIAMSIGWGIVYAILKALGAFKND